MKNDKIYKYLEFLTENIHDTPETYVSDALTKIKRSIEKMFAHTEVDNDGEVKKYGEVVDKENKEKGNMSFKDLGVKMESLEISKYSKMYDNVKLIFSDEEFRYDVTFTIDLKDAVPEEEDKDFSDKDIKKCYIKYKKYDINKNYEMIGELSKTVDIKDINEELLINLKLELDEDYGEGGDEEEFKIETE